MDMKFCLVLATSYY